MLDNPIAQILITECARNALRNLADHEGRSASREPNSITNWELKSCKTRFSDRRHLRKQCRAFRSGSTQREQYRRGLGVA
jgi:hypothetical protein